MSPDSASCSTRGGSGVCGGGSRSVALPPARRRPRPGDRGRRVEIVATVDRSSAARPSCGACAARGRSRTGLSYAGSPISGSMSSSSIAPRRVRTGWVGLASSSVLGGRRAAEQPVAELGQPGRHLVDGRRGDDQDAEEREQHQQRHHDVRRAQQVEQQAGDDEADRAAGLAAGRWRRRAPAAGCRWRCARCRARRSAKRGPADHLAAGRAVVLGVAHVAPADEDQRPAARTSRPCRPSRRRPCG